MDTKTYRYSKSPISILKKSNYRKLSATEHYHHITFPRKHKKSFSALKSRPAHAKYISTVDYMILSSLEINPTPILRTHDKPKTLLRPMTVLTTPLPGKVKIASIRDFKLSKPASPIPRTGNSSVQASIEVKKTRKASCNAQTGTDLLSEWEY